MNANLVNKQHLSRSSVHEKLSNTEAELKKSVAYIKACISVHPAYRDLAFERRDLGKRASQFDHINTE